MPRIRRTKLKSAGWDSDRHSIAEQRTISDGRVIPVSKGSVRNPPKRVDYLLRFTRNLPLAVVEAKARYKSATDAVQEARDYAGPLSLNYAYATNGIEINEIDHFKGTETRVADFPHLAAFGGAIRRAAESASPNAWERLIAPYHTVGGKPPRYHQQIAINRTVEAILAGKKRLSLTMATGTAKSIVAFQICARLWSSGRNTPGEHHTPRIVVLVPRRPHHPHRRPSIIAQLGEDASLQSPRRGKFRDPGDSPQSCQGGIVIT